MKTLRSISKKSMKNIELLSQNQLKNIKGGGGPNSSPMMGCPPPTTEGSMG